MAITAQDLTALGYIEQPRTTFDKHTRFLNRKLCPPVLHLKTAPDGTTYATLFKCAWTTVEQLLRTTTRRMK